MHVHFRVIRKKSMHVLACITYMYAHKCIMLHECCRNFKQLNFNSFLFRKTFLWIHFCQPFSPNYENILFNWCRIYFLQYLDWVHVKGTCHWVGIPTVNAVSYRPSVERLNKAPCFTSGFLVASKQYGGLRVLSNLSLCL